MYIIIFQQLKKHVDGRIDLNYTRYLNKIIQFVIHSIFKKH